MTDSLLGAVLSPAAVAMDFTPFNFAAATVVAVTLSIFAIQDDRNNMEWSILGAGMLGIYWMVNNVVYYELPLWMYVITDTVFTIAYGYLFYISRKFFIAVITLLMAPNIVLDGVYVINKLEYSNMMYWENWLFAAMLFITALNGLNIFILISTFYKKKDR